MEELEVKKKKDVWKGIAVFEMICMLLAISILGYQFIKEKTKTPNIEVVQHGSTTGLESPAQVVPGVTYRYIENLNQKIEAYKNQEAFLPFKLSVENVFGYEYLCFSDGNIKVYYRNEYEDEDFNDRYRVFLDNGTRLAEFDFEFDLNSDLQKLCPKIGSFSEDDTKQLLFLTYGEETSKLPEKLTMVDTSTLAEFKPLIFEEQIATLFDYSYKEEMNQSTSHVTNTMMTLHINSAEYTYNISKEDYIDAVYYEQTPVKFTGYADLDIGEDYLKLTMPMYLSENEFLGELSSNILLKNGTVSLQSVKYGAYVEASQEDPGNSGVITPRDSILERRVIINGKYNRRYLIPFLENVEPNTNDWSNLVEEGGYKVYYENGVKTSIMGIDVSKYQGNVDWKQVKNAGVEYAIIRLGYRGMNTDKDGGNLELDPTFKQNIEGALDAGVPVGVYFFSQAITKEEAIEEAKMVLENIKDYDITYPVVFDTEVVTSYNARANNLTRQERTDITIAFCEEIKAAGYKPMIYANTKWMIMGLDLEQLTAYDKWFAYYGDNLMFPYQFQMLQYSDTGKIPGIEGNVDLNISFIDYSLE